MKCGDRGCIFFIRSLSFSFAHCLSLVYENSIVSWFEFVEDFGHGSYLSSNFFFFLFLRDFYTKLEINFKLPLDSFLHHLLMSLPSLYVCLYRFIQIIIILRTLHSHCSCFIASLYLCCFLQNPKSKINDEGNLMKNKITTMPKYEKKLTTIRTLLYLYIVTILQILCWNWAV